MELGGDVIIRQPDADPALLLVCSSGKRVMYCHDSGTQVPLANIEARNVRALDATLEPA